MRINKVSIDINLAIKHLRYDIRDDWFRDPLEYDDLLKEEIY